MSSSLQCSPPELRHGYSTGWEDFVKAEPNTQDVFGVGDFGCTVPISSSGNPLSSMDDMQGQQSQPFTVPCMVHPSINLGGMEDPNNPNLHQSHNQYRYSAFKMSYPHFQRSYHHSSQPSHLQMHESGRT